PARPPSSTLFPYTTLFRSKALSGANAVDVLVHTPDGREVLLNTSGAPIRDEKGNIERAILIFRDVTEHRRLEQRTADALTALLSDRKSTRLNSSHLGISYA